MGLEGIVAKKADQPYVSGKNVGWIKVRQASGVRHKDQFELFDKSKSSRSVTDA